MRTIRIVAAIVILAALPLTAAARRRTTPLASKSEAKTYAVSTAYTTLSFTATKWMVFKAEGFVSGFQRDADLQFSRSSQMQDRCDRAGRQSRHAQFDSRQSVAFR